MKEIGFNNERNRKINININKTLETCLHVLEVQKLNRTQKPQIRKQIRILLDNYQISICNIHSYSGVVLKDPGTESKRL